MHWHAQVLEFEWESHHALSRACLEFVEELEYEAGDTWWFLSLRKTVNHLFARCANFRDALRRACERSGSPSCMCCNLSAQIMHARGDSHIAVTMIPPCVFSFLSILYLRTYVYIYIYIYIYIYAMCMRRMLALSCTGNKLGLMLYLDGITPGNPLAPVIARKCIPWHASFIELDELLTNEAYWLVVAIARTVHAMHLLSDMCLTRAIPQSGNSDTALCAITHPDRVPER